MKILQHILGWILFLGHRYLSYFADGDVNFKSTAVLISYDLILMGVFYLVYFYLAPWLFKNYSLLRLAMISIIGITVFVLTRYLVQEVLFDIFLGFTNYYNRSFTYFVWDNLWRGFLPVLGGSLVFLIERKVASDKVRLQLQKEKSDAELANLRSQINPHFLFNTMSFLHTEAYLVSPPLADTIMQFSDVLRHSVESAKEKKVTLTSEIQLLKNFISLFEKRFGDQCFVQFESMVEHPEILVEPLLFLPFVENAFKHGKFNDPQNPVRLEIIEKDKQLSFSCYNISGEKQKDYSSGIGLENVRKRLDLLYPDKYELQINDESKQFNVYLQIEL